MGATLIDVVRPSGTPSTHNAPPHPTTSEGSPHSFIAMPIGSKNIFMDTSPVFTIHKQSTEKSAREGHCHTHCAKRCAVAGIVCGCSMSYQSKSESKTQGYVAATEPESCELSPVSTTALSMITPPLDSEFSIFFRSLRFGLKPDSLSRRRLSLDASFLITFCLNFCSCPRSFWRALCWRRRQN